MHTISYCVRSKCEIWLMPETLFVCRLLDRSITRAPISIGIDNVWTNRRTVASELKFKWKIHDFDCWLPLWFWFLVCFFLSKYFRFRWHCLSSIWNSRQCPIQHPPHEYTSYDRIKINISINTSNKSIHISHSMNQIAWVSFSQMHSFISLPSTECHCSPKICTAVGVNLFSSQITTAGVPFQWQHFLENIFVSNIARRAENVAGARSYAAVQRTLRLKM